MKKGRAPQGRHTSIVSSDDDSLILVDAKDVVKGYLSKKDVHDGEGLLHRALSVFLFDEHGDVLLQQRGASKRLWPLFWANSCCSHPRRGEEVDAAAARRTQEELGVRAELTYLYKFIYQAPFGDEGSEHELCSVYVGRISGHLAVNDTEIAATRFVSPERLDEELNGEHSAKFTPWLKLEWPTLRRDHWPAIQRLLSAPAL